MTVPGNAVVPFVLVALFLACTGYAAGRLHQWHRRGHDRDAAYREGYETATRKTFSLAARIIGPRRERSTVRGSASVLPPPSLSAVPSAPRSGPLSSATSPVGSGVSAGAPADVSTASAEAADVSCPAPEPPPSLGSVARPISRRAAARSRRFHSIFPTPSITPAVDAAPAPSAGTAPAPFAGTPPTPTAGTAPAVSADAAPRPSAGAASQPSAGTAPALSAGAASRPSAGAASTSSGGTAPTPSAGTAPANLPYQHPAAEVAAVQGHVVPSERTPVQTPKHTAAAARQHAASEEAPAEASAPASASGRASRPGRHLVPDELVRAATYRLSPDRVARAKVPGAQPTPGVEDGDRNPPTAVPKPRRHPSDDHAGGPATS